MAVIFIKKRFYIFVDILAICAVLVRIFDHFHPVSIWLIVLSYAIIFIDLIVNIIYFIHCRKH